MLRRSRVAGAADANSTNEILFKRAAFTADNIPPHLLTGRTIELPPRCCTPFCAARMASCLSGGRHGRFTCPGSMQLPPAGCVDAAAVRQDGAFDLDGQLFRELDEELGLSPDAIEQRRLP